MPLKVVPRAGSDMLYLRGSVRGQSVYESTGTADPVRAEGIRAKREAELWDRSVYGARAVEAHIHETLAPRLHGANPLARMWRSGASELDPVEKPKTAATAIRIGNPRSWKKALRAVQETGGLVMDVCDEEMAEAKSVIGRDGIGCEPASATTLAALRRLTELHKIDRDATVVSILTGHALKDTDFILKSNLSQPVMQGERHA